MKKKPEEKIKQILELDGRKKEILFLTISGLALLCSILKIRIFGADPAWIAIVLCGVPILMEAVAGLVFEFDITADVLVALALIASVVIGEYFAAGEVAVIMQLGGLLEELTVAKARAGIERLVRMTPVQARKVVDGEECLIPAEKVEKGDILRVLPGEMIAVDGIILSGNTAVDQSVMTGESLPVDKGPGEEVMSGCVNQFGAFEMRAEKIGADSSIQRMIRLAESASADKAKIVSLADRWAVWVVVIALTASFLTFLITHQILRSVTILVVFCPCSLVLATPTAIMAAIGNASKYGFLVKEGDALESLALVSKICFDKTGTLTQGKPQVTAVESTGEISRDELYRLAAAAEARSEHPLGKTVVAGFLSELRKQKAETMDYPADRQRESERRFQLPQPEQFRMIPGHGIQAVVEGKHILAGNTALLEENAVSVDELSAMAQRWLEEGCSVIYVALDGVPAGILALADLPRENTAAVMEEIIRTGVSPVLLTGDNRKAAEHVARQLGFRKVEAECLPEDKLSYIRESQKLGHRICMIGDGVNDAPSLKAACVGIAMGGIGSDAAVEAADIVLVSDEIAQLPHLILLSRRMMTTIRCNLTFSMTLNVVAIILAITGILNPVVGALVHNCGSVLVIISSAFLLKWKS